MVLLLVLYYIDASFCAMSRTMIIEESKNAFIEALFQLLKNESFDLYQEGLTEKEIERKTGINRTTFRRYRQKYGITINDKTE